MEEWKNSKQPSKHLASQPAIIPANSYFKVLVDFHPLGNFSSGQEQQLTSVR